MCRAMRPVGGGPRCTFGQTNFTAVLAKRTSRRRSTVRPRDVSGQERRTELHSGQTNFASARIADLHPPRKRVAFTRGCPLT